MACRWVPIGLVVTAMATPAVSARADTPADVAAAAEKRSAPARAAGEGQSRLAIVVPVESDVDGLEILRDDALVPDSSYGVALPVDAGMHVLMARAPGRLPWSTQFRLTPGKTTVTVSIPRLSAALPVAPTSPVAAPAPATAPATATATGADRIERDPGKTDRIFGLVLGGVGLASVAAGVWLGFDAASTQRELRPQCPRGYCSAEASAAIDQARTQQAAATTLLAIGLASSVGAAIVFLTMPSAPAPEKRTTAFQLAPAIAPGGASVVAAGKF
jgi:hypothetical protein